MVGWHHQLDEHEFEQVPGVDDEQAHFFKYTLYLDYIRLGVC